MEKMRSYCIDSDIIIDYLRGIPKARDFLVEAGDQTTLFISVVTVMEVYAGKDTRDTTKRDLIDAFLDGFHIVELPRSLAQHAGVLRREYGRPFADMVIAATAIEYSLILVTRNIRHFRGIKSLEIRQPY